MVIISQFSMISSRWAWRHTLSLVDLEQCKKNVTKERASFADVLRMALKEKDLKLYYDNLS